jgi:O-antigen/teichoic acid export membrane protein
MTSPEHGLKQSAGSALVWSATFTLGRDLIQFGTMLILVRILSPQIYGQFALAQTVHIFLAVISVKTIAPFALQARDPENFDWDLQFTAGAVLNGSVFVISLMLAGGFYVLGGDSGRSVGMLLAVMAFVFPIEIIGTHYFTWLQAHHLWKRMRLLLFAGTALGSIAAIGLANFGGGAFALAVGNLCFTLPLLLEYAARRPFPLRLQPGRLHLYSRGREFGLNRVASGGLQAGSSIAEQSIISGLFGFSTLGLYTRAVGLAQITSGRIGPVVAQALYPVLTRAEASSDRFQRFAGILFQGALWTSVPAAAFLGLEADRLVRLLYGEKWLAVIPLMAAAAALLALRGLHLTMNQIMLANLQQKDCLRLDWIAAISMVAVILSTAFLGPKFYLFALTVHAAIVLLGTSYLAVKGGAIAAAHTVRVIGGCAVAVLIATSVVAVLPSLAFGSALTSTVITLMAHGVGFGVSYTLTLRMLMPSEVVTIVEASPVPSRIQDMILPLLILRRRHL